MKGALTPFDTRWRQIEKARHFKHTLANVIRGVQVFFVRCWMSIALEKMHLVEIVRVDFCLIRRKIFSQIYGREHEINLHAEPPCT
jgi:hypothetical protein